MDFSEISERAIIEHIKRVNKLPSDSRIIKGIGDDCAVLRSEGNRCLLVTTDTLVAGVHFDLEWHPPFLLGRKTAAVNLSDIAAMGGIPRFALLNMALHSGAPAWLEKFLEGFHDMLQEHDTHLVGGDTVKCGGDLSLTVTLIGEAAEEAICYRSSAVAGDLVFVSGALGDAAAGLDICRSRLPQEDSPQWLSLQKAHLDPQPLIQLGRMLAKSNLVHAMMDVSDGLATDMAHICKDSGKAAEIFKETIPVSENLRAAAEKTGTPWLEWALQGGEDYQLLFTAPPEHEEKIRNLVFAETGREIFRIGRIVAGKGVMLVDGEDRYEISFQGYDHFGG